MFQGWLDAADDISAAVSANDEQAVALIAAALYDGSPDCREVADALGGVAQEIRSHVVELDQRLAELRAAIGRSEVGPGAPPLAVEI